MVTSSSDLKKEIIFAVLDFSINIEKHKQSGQFSLDQISEMLAIAIEINNLINMLDMDSSANPSIKKPALSVIELKRVKRVLELHLKYSSDLNSIAIDIGENLSTTNRYLQKGVEYILDNVALKSFATQVRKSEKPKPQVKKQARPQKQVPRKKATPGLSFVSFLMFITVLVFAGFMVYNMFFDHSATRVTSLVKEYRSDRKLSSVSRPEVAGTIKVQGTKAVLNIFDALKNNFRANNPKIAIEVEGGDSGIAIRDLVDGKISLAASSKIPSVDDRKKAARFGRALADHRIALDSVAVFVHKSNPVNMITLDQLKKIYSDDALSWNQANPQLKSKQKITRFSLSKESGTFAFFTDRVMYSAPTSQEIIHIYTPNQMIDLVAANPNAIGFASLSSLMNNKKVKIIKIASIFNEKGTKPVMNDGALNADAVRRGEYPLTRYLYVISAGDLNTSQAKFIDFLRSPLAQSGLGKFGLVGII